ncbi:hypothetical protein BLOT_005523 [Blomia tropicalis]|nr:hypothetical protein BLOT_005523 [Blomia tropicalis]
MVTDRESESNIKINCSGHMFNTQNILDLLNYKAELSRIRKSLLFSVVFLVVHNLPSTIKQMDIHVHILPLESNFAAMDDLHLRSIRTFR